MRGGVEPSPAPARGERGWGARASEPGERDPGATVEAWIAWARRPKAAAFLDLGKLTSPSAAHTEPAGTPMVVQRKEAYATALSPEELRSEAAGGVAGANEELPHLGEIQRAFGPHDLTGIKARVGGAAAVATDAIGAHAYATDGRVAFGEPPSLRTAAHEAAHVVQQRGPLQVDGGVGRAGDEHERAADAVADAVVAGRSAVPLLGAEPPPPAPPGASSSLVQRLPREFKPLVDRIAKERKGPDHTWLHLETLEKMEAIAQAVDRGSVENARAAVKAFLTEAAANPLDAATAVLLGDVPLALVSRVFGLGLTEESQQLRKHFFRDSAGKRSYEQPSSESDRASEFAVWERIVHDQLEGASAATPEKAKAGIDRILLVLGELTKTLKALDAKEVVSDLNRPAGLVPDSLSFPSYPDSSVGGFFSHIVSALVVPLATRLSVLFQTLLDAAMTELQTRSTTPLAAAKPASLDLVRSVVDQLEPTIALLADPRLNLENLVDVTRSDFKGRTKRHLDEFDHGPKAATVAIDSFRASEQPAIEKKLPLLRLFQVRVEQVKFLEKLYGFEKTGPAGVASADNAAAIKAAGGLKLHDDESWRSFLLAKFKLVQKRESEPFVALGETIDILQDYLRAFTIHTPYNIDEFGDNYIGRSFPRALTGQLIHDCGVYMLRVAYALSLVRREANLVFRAVAMPLHVGLVITFTDVLKGGFFLNNEAIEPVRPEKMKELATHWMKSGKDGASLPQPVPLDQKQLLGEVSAATFVEHADMPFRMEDVPAVPDNAHRREVLWDFYHQKITGPPGRPQPVVAPAKGEPQPELRYLDLLKQEREFHNKTVIPFWLAANATFHRSRSSLESAGTTLAKGKPAERAAAQKVLADHKAALVTILKALQVKERLTALDAARDEVTKFLQQHPEAVAPGSSVASAKRLWITRAYERELDDVLGDAADPKRLLPSSPDRPSWEDNETRPVPVD